MAESIPTAPERLARQRIRRARAVRRGFFVAVCLVVAAGATGRLGPLDGVARASGNGYHLEVAYPRVSRPGLAAGLTVTIRRAGAWGPALTLALPSGYLEHFDVNGIDPEPAGASSDGDRQIFRFETPPAGDRMRVSFDARIEPGRQPARARGLVAVLEDGREVVSVWFTTTVLP